MSETGTTNTATTGTTNTTSTGTATTGTTNIPITGLRVAISTNVTGPVVAGAMVLPCLDSVHSTVRAGDAVWGLNIAPSSTVVRVEETGGVQVSAPTLGPIDTGAMITFARDLPA